VTNPEARRIKLKLESGEEKKNEKKFTTLSDVKKEADQTGRQVSHGRGGAPPKRSLLDEAHNAAIGKEARQWVMLRREQNPAANTAKGGTGPAGNSHKRTGKMPPVSHIKR